MKHRFPSTFIRRLMAGCLLLGIFSLILAGPISGVLGYSTPDQQMEKAWRQAQDIGRYQFETTVLQTIHPTLSIENVGLTSHTEKTTITGELDRPAETMSMQLAIANQSPIELMVDEGVSFGRLSATEEWTELEADTNIFAPGGDPLGFLDAAEDVTVLSDTEGPTTISNASTPYSLLPASSLQNISRYQYQLSGPKYAAMVRGELQEQLREKGVLPTGISVGLAQEYVDMTGTGELWVSANGLPVRQIVTLRFPPQPGASEWVEAEIVTDFSNWDAQMAEAASFDFGNPVASMQAMVGRLHISADAVQNAFLSTAVFFAFISFAVFLAVNGRSPEFRAVLNIVLIGSLLLAPMLQANQVAAFNEYVESQNGNQNAEQAAPATDYSPESDFDPHNNPLSNQKGAIPEELQAIPSAANLQAAVNNVVDPLANCVVTPTSDCDGDGLLDKIEIFELGTRIDRVDTDKDGISDNFEVTGFSLGGRTWYTDPLNPDTNQDGNIDGNECLERKNVITDTIDLAITPGVCSDTDNDNIPEIFDFDNDGDGVPDRFDISDYETFTVTNKTFNLQLTGAATDKPLYVDINVRPTDDQHLWWTNNYLDWPDEDRSGQIMRVTTDTLSTRGDMQLVPLMEVTLPYSANDPARGLPVLSTANYNNITATTPITTWLDTAALEPYSISVERGAGTDLIMYVPLNVVEDDVGGTPLAWNARLLYQLDSSAAGWGAAHQMRLIWVVQAITDSCKPPNGQDRESYCANEANWTSSKSIVQTYPEDFIVTGITIEEDLGSETLMIGQNQSASGNANYESQLWYLADVLQDTYMQAQNRAPDTRLTLSDISTEYTNWGIPAADLDFAYTGNIGNEADLLTAVSFNTAQTFLDNTLYPTDPVSGTIANILYLSESTSRQVGLGDFQITNNGNTVISQTTFANNTFTFDFANAATATSAAMRFRPYLFNSGGWTTAQLGPAIEDVGTSMTTVFDNALLASISDQQLADWSSARIGAVVLAQNYYLSAYNGIYNIVDHSELDLSVDLIGSYTRPTEPIADIVDNLSAYVQSHYKTISLANINIPTVNVSQDAVGTAAWKTLAGSKTAVLQAFGDTFTPGKTSATSLSLVELESFNISLDPAVDSQVNSSTIYYAQTSAVYRMQSEGTGFNGQVVGSIDGNLAVAIFYGGRIANTVKNVVHYTEKIQKLADAQNKINQWTTRANQKEIGVTKAEVADYKNFLKKAKSSAKMWGAISIVKAVGTSIYSFIKVGIDKSTDYDSAEFSYFVATQVAAILVAVIQVAIKIAFSASGIASLVFSVLFLVDLIVAGICAIINAASPGAIQGGSDVDKWVCGGITGAVVRGLSYIINDFTYVVDLDHDNRLNSAFETPSISAAGDVFGPVVGNQVTISATITNTLHMGSPNWMGYIYAGQLTDDRLDDAAFAYRIQSSKQGFEGPLSYGDTSWTIVPGRSNFPLLSGDARFYKDFSVSGNYTFAEPGIDKGVPLYFSEALVTPAQNCWLIPNPLIIPPVVPVCWIQRFDTTLHAPLNTSFVYDVLPATLDGFNTLIQVKDDSYRLAWGETFPTLMDADGDGLISKAHNGIDPNDSSIDTDGDGLTDAFEMNNNGFDELQADTDCDGLIDYWEAFYNTDPLRPDTDNDGITDSEEMFHRNNLYPFENSSLSNNNAPACSSSSDTFIGGWSFVYDYNGTTPLTTWVNANPLDPDTDDDSLLDGRERTYGYNPRVVSTLNVLDLKSDLETSSGALPYLSAADTITYTANITNELDNRYMLGLLQTEIPLDTVINNQALGVLAPRANLTTQGTIDVSQTNLSGDGGMGIRAGVNINEGTGRVLWLNMNEPNGASIFADDSYLGNDATCVSCPTANRNYLVFNSGQQLNVTDNASFDLTTFSAGFNLYHTGTSGTGTLLEMNGFRIRLVNGALEVTTNLGSAVFANTAVSANQWHHVMVTVSGSHVVLFVNGIQQREVTNATTVTLNNNDLTIGWPSGGGAVWIDEVEIFDTALDNATVKRFYGLPILSVDMKNSSTWGSDHVSCSGSACPSVAGSGALFDRQKKHLTVSTPNLPSDAFTFATWIKPVTRKYPFNAANAAAQGYWTDDDYHGVFGYQDPNDSSTIFPTLYVSQDGRLRMLMGDGTNTCNITTNSTGVVQNSQWQHLVVAYDGNNFTFYVDGQPVEGGVNGTSCAPVSIPSVSNFYVGRPNEFGYLYIDRAEFNYVDDFFLGQYHQLEDGNGSKSELRLNLNGDEAADNVWSENVNNFTSSVSFDIDRRLTDADVYNFRFWENDVVFLGDDNNTDKKFINDIFQGDDSFVYEYEIRNTTYLGTTDHRIASSESSGSGTNARIVKTEGYLYWDVSNEYFNGQLNDFRLYDYTLTPEAVADMFQATSASLELGFDEAPGATQFADTSGNNVTVSCNGDTCPISGLPGRIGQALEFDGNDDFLTVSASGAELSLNSGGYTVMAWVKSGDSWWLDSSVSANRALLGSPTRSDKMGFIYGRPEVHKGSFQDVEAPGSATLRADWNHVAYVYDAAISNVAGYGIYKVYVNGIEVAQQYGTPFINDDIIIGNYNTSSWGGFKGLMDELQILKFPLSAAEIQAEIARAPMVNLHLDEDGINGRYDDDTESGPNGTGFVTSCSGDTCPQPGSKGQIREAATFDGSDFLTVEGTDAQLTDFTISMWVKPSHQIGERQYLMTKADGNQHIANFRLWLENDSMTLRFDKQYTCTNSESLFVGVSASGTPLFEDQWNHVVATHDPSIGFGVMSIYINGALAVSQDVGAAMTCSLPNPIRIGQNFHGALDEVTVNNSVLTDDQISALYAYQSAWFDKINRFDLILDETAPTVDLSLIPQYVGTSNTVMFLTGADADSKLGLIEYRIKVNVNDVVPWQAAEPDTDLTLMTDAWTFEFPAAAPGTYLVEARATDNVGNVSTIGSATVIVDGIAPTLTQNVPSGVQPGGAPLAVTGTATDTGSGVAENGLQIAISGVNELTPLTDQLVTVATNGSWATTVTLPEQPYGIYTINTTAGDAVNNQTTVTDQVAVDGLAPYADVMLDELYLAEGKTRTIYGVASDIPHLANSRTLHLHFESGDGLFTDGTENQFRMTCASCPTETAGRYGTAVTFNGTSNTLAFTTPETLTTTTVPSQLGVVDGSFTVMAWVNNSSWTGSQAILGSSPADGLFVGLQDGAPFLGYDGDDNVAPATVPADTWTHVAWRLDAADGEQTFFINGLPVGDVITGTLPYSSTNELLVGSARGGNFYGGSVDELVVYGQAVSNDQIYDIANPLNVGISDLKIRFRSYDDRNMAPTSGTWYPVTLSSNSSNFVPWTFAMPNNFAPGSYKIDLRVTDTVGNGDNSSFIGGAWDGVIIRPDLSISIASDTTLAALGGDVTHTIVYTNTGLVDADNVQITNVVPVDATFNAGLSSAGWNCVPDSSTGSVCTYDVGTMTVGQSGTIDFGVTVANGLSAGTLGIENTAVISSSTDFNDTNNSATVLTPVDAGFDLEVSISNDGTPYNYDDFAPQPVFTVTYSNNGSQTAVAELVEVLPDGVQSTYQSFLNGWDCESIYSGGTCRYPLGEVAPGASGTVTVTYAIEWIPPATDTVTNTITIQEVNGAPDLNPANDTDSINTPFVLGFAIIPHEETVTVPEGETAVLTGTVNDTSGTWTVEYFFNPDTPPPTIGTIVGEAPDTTWQWTYTTTDGLDESQLVTFYGEFNEGGVVISHTFPLTVTNVPPTIDLIGADSALVNNSYSLQLGSVVDPGDDTVSACTINWGDGASEDCFGAIGGGTLNHTYTEALATPTITVDLTDEDGTHLAAGSKTISVDAASLLVNVQNANVSVDEGADMTVVNNGRYSPTDGSVVLSASEGTVIDNGDGSWSWSYDASQGAESSRTVTISANGGAETATFTLNVTGDGVDGSDETSVIAGDDGNGDGIEDSNQLNVAAIPLTGGQYAILELNDGFTFRNVAQSDTTPATPPTIAAYPAGYFSGTINDLTPGGTVSMTLLLSDMSGINSFYLYGPTPENGTPDWYEFLYDNGTGIGAQILPDRIEVTFVDGGLGDADLTADGTITFNGAPADAIPQYTLTVNQTGLGSVTPSTTTYSEGAVVNLTAVPDPGWEFVGWSGALSGTSTNESVTMNSDLVVNAEFVQTAYTLTDAVVGNGEITIDPAQDSYFYGDEVTITAVSALGSTFDGWSGDLSGNTASQQLTIDGNKAVTATFSAIPYSINTNVVGSGAITLTPNQVTYEYGDEVLVEAVPTAGWSFDGWSGDKSGAGLAFTFVMTESKSVTATFSEDAYVVNLEAVGNGQIEIAPSAPTYSYGDVVTVTAVPAPGNSFDGWFVDASGTAISDTITVDGDQDVVAQFSAIAYNLTLDAQGNGSIVAEPQQDSYGYGDVVTVTAVPDAGHVFLRWDGILSQTTTLSDTIVIEADAYVAAIFETEANAPLLTVNLAGTGSGTVSSDPAGIACPGDCDERYAAGTVVTLTVTVDAPSIFNGWGGACTGTGVCVVTMDEAKTVTATIRGQYNTFLPIIMSDAATINEDNSVTIDVLANDSDPDGDSLQIESITSPTNGTSEIMNNMVVYRRYTRPD